MALIHRSDPDFKVCRIGYEDLVGLQSDAESRGFATRWSSVAALRAQVQESEGVLLSPLMREMRGPELRAYRCVVLFSVTSDEVLGGIATIDVAPETFISLARIDRDEEVSRAFSEVFQLALGCISPISKI